MIHPKIQSLTIALLMFSCGETSDHQVSAKKERQISGETTLDFQCQQKIDHGNSIQRNGCRLKMPKHGVIFSGVDSIEAKYSIRYTLSCKRQRQNSTIEIFTNKASTSLGYARKNLLITLPGTGSLQVRDSNPEETFDEVFFNPDCKLNLSWNVLPASSQIKIWEQSVKALQSRTETALLIQSHLREVRQWINDRIHPSDASVASTLDRSIERAVKERQKIEELIGANTNSSIDKRNLLIRLNALNLMIVELNTIRSGGGRINDLINKVESSSSDLKQIKEEARSLLGEILFWQSHIQSEVNQLITDLIKLEKRSLN